MLMKMDSRKFESIKELKRRYTNEYILLEITGESLSSGSGRLIAVSTNIKDLWELEKSLKINTHIVKGGNRRL